MTNEIRFQATNQLEKNKPVRIPISIVLDRPTKVRGIHAKFQGAEETKATYTTTSTNHKGQVTTQTHTAVERVDVTTRAFLLQGNERLSFFGNVTDALATIFGGGVHEVIQPGEYDFEVEVEIPENAPPTHVGKKTRVFYELSVQVDIPLAVDLKATHAFQVAAQPSHIESVPVRSSYPETDKRGVFESMFAPDVQIEVALAGSAVRCGDPITGIFVLETEKPIRCNKMRVRLLGVERSEAKGHKNSFTHKGVAIELDTPSEIIGTFTQEFTMTAEGDAPVSARGRLFSIDWYVQIELDVPWAKDPHVRVPIQLFAV